MPEASTTDPDLVQAIDDLSIIAARLRSAERLFATLRPDAPLKTSAAASQEISELRSRIRLRADRLALHPDALMLILDEANTLRGQRRLGLGEGLRRAVERLANDARDIELEMNARRTRITQEAERATRTRIAADNALRAIEGIAA